jgi:acetyltransferase-like isoleucine patch superfamily enzyme
VRPRRPRASWNYSETTLARGIWNRLLQVIALWAPGAYSLRPALHRLRGVAIGRGVFLAVGVILETDRPWQVAIGDRASFGVRVTVIAHFADQTGAGEDDPHRVTVRIEDDVFVGPGSILLPNVTIGRGAVVAAGSVVTRSVPPLTLVRGNPAEPVARSRVPLVGTSTREYYGRLELIRPPGGTAPG